MRRQLLAVATALVLVLGVGRAGSGSAETLEAVTVNWAPYYGSELENGGVIAELARAAFEQQGHSLKVEFIPWKRAMAMAKRGRYDAVLGAYHNAERAQDFIFSTPFYDIEIGLMALNDLGLRTYDSLKALKSYRIGYNDGWAYGDAFENADYLKKDPASNQTLNVRKLFHERIDIVAMARGIFRYEVNQMENASLDEVTFIEPVLRTGELHMVFSKEIDNARALRDAFDTGMAAIKANGTYDEILAAYGF